MIENKVQLTHKAAVKRMALWLRNSRGCAVVMVERMVTACSEQPDVIGWGGGGNSVLIECKVSRSDFLADAKKHFRRYEETGVGTERFFAAPRGLLQPDEMPAGWGLLAIGDFRVRVLKDAIPKSANKSAEVAMLVSAIRRLEISASVFVQHEPQNDIARSDA